MKRFLIKIKLSDGYQANIRVTAKDGDAAIRRIENQPEFIKFIEGREILEIEFEEIPIVPISPDNYLLQPSATKGWWVVTDIKRNIVVKFQQGKFNDTQQNTILFDDATMNELEYATAMRELGEYMNQYHREIIL
jgi:hypothetical protein